MLGQRGLCSDGHGDFLKMCTYEYRMNVDSTSTVAVI